MGREGKGTTLPRPPPTLISPSQGRTPAPIIPCCCKNDGSRGCSLPSLRRSGPEALTLPHPTPPPLRSLPPQGGELSSPASNSHCSAQRRAGGSPLSIARALPVRTGRLARQRPAGEMRARRFECFFHLFAPAGRKKVAGTRRARFSPRSGTSDLAAARSQTEPRRAAAQVRCGAGSLGAWPRGQPDSPLGTSPPGGLPEWLEGLARRRLGGRACRLDRVPARRWAGPQGLSSHDPLNKLALLGVNSLSDIGRDPTGWGFFLGGGGKAARKKKPG